MGMFSNRTPRNATPTPKLHEAVVDRTFSSPILEDEQQYVAVAAVPPAIIAVPPAQSAPLTESAPSTAPVPAPSVAEDSTSADDDAPPDAAASGAAGELQEHWLVLSLSCLAYVFLQASNAFVPAITMQGTSEALGMPISAIGALNSAGAGIKSILIIFAMGPVLDLVGRNPTSPRPLHSCNPPPTAPLLPPLPPRLAEPPRRPLLSPWCPLRCG